MLIDMIARGLIVTMIGSAGNALLALRQSCSPPHT
jgi:hypothetical protein